MSDVSTFISTSGRSDETGFCEAVVQGVAPDGGLYFPQEIPALPSAFQDALPELSVADIGWHVLRPFIPDTTISDEDLRQLVEDAFDFSIPIVEVEKGIYSLELFHGPTLAFKDIGARFLGRILPCCTTPGQQSVVLVATSGDTGSAVAHGLLGVDGVEVLVLYPKGKVSPLQEKQFASLGGNITALAIDGVFDDCQRLVKQAFADEELKQRFNLTSANSINIARWLPQAVYYFLPRKSGLGKQLVVSVPSGNFGNLTAGILAAKMGIPGVRFIAACNANAVVPEYLATGDYHPRPSIQTIANAMDVGDPSNFVRLQALFHDDLAAMRKKVDGFTLNDDAIRATIKACWKETGYLLDPHGAVGYAALKSSMRDDETGVFLATAHPAKFAEVYSGLGIPTPTHERLEMLRERPVLSQDIPNDYRALKSFIQQKRQISL